MKVLIPVNIPAKGLFPRIVIVTDDDGIFFVVVFFAAVLHQDGRCQQLPYPLLPLVQEDTVGQAGQAASFKACSACSSQGAELPRRQPFLHQHSSQRCTHIMATLRDM